jgi:hypothetical protein
MQKTFDFYRSTNGRLAATLDQEDSYGRYLKRVESILDRKPQVDRSPSQYMGFLNKCREVSRNHRSQEYLAQLNADNQILLGRIVETKNRQAERQEARHLLAMHEKRFREQQQINEENKRIALRVIQQGSTLQLRHSDWTRPLKPNSEKSFYESRVKERQLPKLLPARN